MKNMVDEIKEKLEVFHDLEFYEDTHTYKIKDKVYTSVTTKLKEIEVPFDKEAEAFKKSKQTGESIQNIIDRWARNGKKATDLGTEVHLFAELYYDDRKLSVDEKIIDGTDLAKLYSKSYQDLANSMKKGVVKFYTDRPELKMIGQEIRVYHPLFNIAGTIDGLGYDESTNSIIELDWKTNKEIFNYHYNNYLSKPFNRFKQNNFSKYSCQLNVYAYILNEIADIKVDKMQLIHLSPNDYTIIDIPNLYKDIELWLNPVKHSKLDTKHLNLYEF